MLWAETRPAGDVDLFWDNTACSSDGLVMLVAPRPGRLYTSVDGGATWVERQPAGNVDQQWNGVAVSHDGLFMVAGISGGRLYTSANSGVNWTERQPAGNVDRFWRCAAADADGTNLLVGTASNLLWISTDSGVTWAVTTPLGAHPWEVWNSVASDATGTNLVAANDVGRVYTTVDGGTNWTDRQILGPFDLDWWCASDTTGLKLLATNGIPGPGVGDAYTSVDGGANWITRVPTGVPNTAMRRSASSLDGARLLTISLEALGATRVWYSIDSGVAWSDEPLPPPLPAFWTCVALGVDGATTRALAGSGGLGRLFRTIAAPPAPVATVPSPDFYRTGKSILKCANVWDWCLKNSECPWHEVDWAAHGCIPVKCWRLEDDPLHAIPEQGREFHKLGTIPLPVLPSVDTQILQFDVPLGFDGILYSVLCKFVGTGFVNGDGNLIWRFRQNQRWVKSLSAIPTELGDFTAYMQLDEYIRIYSGQTIRAYGWVSPASGIKGGSMIAALQGWYFPSQFAR